MTAAALGTEYAKRKAAGQQLTRADAREIVLQGAAKFIGTAIAARVGQPMLKGLKSGGRTFGARIREINTQRVEVRKLAIALQKGRGIGQAANVLTKDGILLDRNSSFSTTSSIRQPISPRRPRRKGRKPSWRSWRRYGSTTRQRRRATSAPGSP